MLLFSKKKKYKNILAKSAVHPGTFKLYVNYIQIADVTQINEDLYHTLLKNTIVRESIHYAPLQFLRMNLFLELSRPRGDITRWEKVMIRLIKLNESFPFTITNCKNLLTFEHHGSKDKSIYNFFHDKILNDSDSDFILIGEYAIKQYSKYFPETLKGVIQKGNKYPSFILISSNSKSLVNNYEKEFELQKINNDKNIKIEKLKNVDDFLPTYYNISVNNVHYVTIFQTEGCQNYNTIQRNKITLKIGTLDTLLYYYFMFFYLDLNEELKNHLHCYCFILFYLQENYKVNNFNLLRRFNLSCIGNQTTIEDMIDLKNKKFSSLKNKKTSDEYKKYFLKYIPRQNKTKKKKKN